MRGTNMGELIGSASLGSKSQLQVSINTQRYHITLQALASPALSSVSKSMLKDDPLTRIQREIIEVTEREKEFREGHFRINRLMSESTIDMNHDENHNGLMANGNAAPPKPMGRALSTPYLAHNAHTPPTTPTNPNTLNGYTRKFAPQSGQRGIMQRFIASKGKLSLSPMNTSPTMSMNSSIPSPVISGELLTTPRLPEGKPARKGFVPVEQKIQKELKDMKDREHELKLMRKKRRPFDLASLDLSDDEILTDSEDEEYDIPAPGKLKATKSIGELYEALKDVPRTPSPNGSSHDSFGTLKPAKSLHELCQLNPGEEFLAPSSTRLIAQWESIIQQKQEAGAA